MANQVKQSERRKTNFNFGVRGWLLCLYCMIGYMVIGGAFWVGTAQNTMVALKATQIGVDSAAILGANSLAGFIGAVILLGVGVLFAKYKTRIIQTVLMVLCGIVLMWYGRVSSLAAYTVCFVLMDVTSNGTSSVGLAQIANSYFPTKKGSFLGWATIGSNLAALISLSILGALIAKWNVEVATTCFGIFTIIMGLINWFFIPSNPRDAGFEPDNGDFTAEELAAFNARMSGEPVWTMKEVLKDKNFWLLPLGYGLLFMCSNGFLSQMVPYQIEQIRGPIVQGLMATGNFDNMGAAIGAAMSDGTIAAKASSYMKILPILALPGSIFSGWLDQKIGTRRTGIIMAIFYVIAGVAGGLLPFNTFTNWIFMGSFFFWTGANANLVMSHAGTTYGPRDYAKVWGRMAPLYTIIRVFAPMVLSICLARAATTLIGYRTAYTVFGIAALVAVILIYFSDEKVIKEPGKAPTARTKF